MIRETSETFGIITKENRFRGITFFVIVTLTLVVCKKIFFCLHISSLFFVLFFGNVLNLILQIFITQYNFSTGVALQLFPKWVLSSFFKLIVGRSHCMGISYQKGRRTSRNRSRLTRCDKASHLTEAVANLLLIIPWSLCSEWLTIPSLWKRCFPTQFFDC